MHECQRGGRRQAPGVASLFVKQNVPLSDTRSRRTQNPIQTSGVRRTMQQEPARDVITSGLPEAIGKSGGAGGGGPDRPQRGSRSSLEPLRQNRATPTAASTATARGPTAK